MGMGRKCAKKEFVIETVQKVKRCVDYKPRKSNIRIVNQTPKSVSTMSTQTNVTPPSSPVRNQISGGGTQGQKTTGNLLKDLISRIERGEGAYKDDRVLDWDDKPKSKSKVNSLLRRSIALIRHARKNKKAVANHYARKNTSVPRASKPSLMSRIRGVR